MARMIRAAAVEATLLALVAASISPASAETHSIDAQKSVLTVRVYKSGLFSAFAHNHEIRAPIQRGQLNDSEQPSVELWVDAASLRVVDPEASARDRGEIQKTMQSPEVLDIGRFQGIHFRSSAVQKTAANRWTVRGQLDLHGQTRPVAVEVEQKSGRYQGSATLSQRDFGITPVSIAGGAVKVKDEVKIEFDVVALDVPAAR
jgi:polyisoprenoid-binding protein YceI